MSRPNNAASAKEKVALVKEQNQANSERRRLTRQIIDRELLQQQNPKSTTKKDVADHLGPPDREAVDHSTPEIFAGMLSCLSWLMSLGNTRLFGQLLVLSITMLVLGFHLCKVPVVSLVLPCRYYKVCDYAWASPSEYCNEAHTTEFAPTEVWSGFRGITSSIFITARDRDQEMGLSYALSRAGIRLLTFSEAIEYEQNFTSKAELQKRVAAFIDKSRRSRADFVAFQHQSVAAYDMTGVVLSSLRSAVIDLTGRDKGHSFFMNWIADPILALFVVRPSELLAKMTIDTLFRIADEITGNSTQRMQSLLEKGLSLETRFQDMQQDLDTIRTISNIAMKDLGDRQTQMTLFTDLMGSFKDYEGCREAASWIVYNKVGQYHGIVEDIEILTSRLRAMKHAQPSQLLERVDIASLALAKIGSDHLIEGGEQEQMHAELKSERGRRGRFEQTVEVVCRADGHYFRDENAA